MANITGDCGNNALTGTARADLIRGLGGNDRLYGRGGDDTLEGGNGRDTLYGGAGNDILVGGRGRDILYGGEGSDTFVFDDRDAGDAFSGPLSDVIRDFSSADTIDIASVDVVSFDGYGVREPQRGAFSIWDAQGVVHVTWNTFGGFHDVEVQGFEGSLDDLYSRIRWYDDDYLANVDTTGRIAAGETRDGRIEVEGDRDWFRVQLESDQVYLFDARGEADGSGMVPSPYVTLYDADGNYVTEGYEEIRISDKSGTYYVQVGSYWGTGSYELAASAFADDYAGDPSTTGEIAVGGLIEGEIVIGYDSDWFRIELEGDRTYLFDARGEGDGAGTLTDPYVTLYDSDGNYLTEGYEELAFSGETGTYFVGVWSYNSGTYELAATEIVDDYAGDPSTTGELAVGGIVDGEVQYSSDSDWFRIELEGDQVYMFDARGEADGGGTLIDPYVTLYDIDGNYLTDGYEEVAFSGEAGTYFVGVSSYSKGTYQLAASEIVDDYEGDSDTTGEIAAGETVGGELEFRGDHDWFRISLVEGETYQFDLRGKPSGSGTLGDPYLTLWDDEGNWVSSDDDGSGSLDSRLDYVAERTGDYFVDAGACCDDSTGTYEVGVELLIA